MRRIHFQDVIRAGERFHVGLSTYTKPTGDLHDHDFVEFFWVTEGRGAHMINDTELTVETGDLFFIRAADAHGFRCTDGPLSLANIAFPAAHLAELAERYPVLAERYWPARGPIAPLPVQRRLSPSWCRQMDAAAQELLERRHRALALDACLLRLVDALESQPAAAPKPVPVWLRQALQSIRRPEHFRLGAAEFARLCGRRHEHVSRVLRAHSGQTPSALITELRMAHAARRLALSDQPILDLAYDCGYQSLGQFYAAFKRHTGTTPGRYRSRQSAVF